MSNVSVLSVIKKIGRPVFTTREISAASGKSLSAAVQALAYLERQGMLMKVSRGIWAETGSGKMSAYKVIPFLLPRHRAYVSFISALHLYGIVEQIPQVITLASTSHTKTIKTRLGAFEFHQIAPSFFKGFDWYGGKEEFLIAEPEKALVDSLYISSFKRRRFGHFPELRFPESFDFKKAKMWVRHISNPRLRIITAKKLARIESLKSAST